MNLSRLLSSVSKRALQASRDRHNAVIPFSFHITQFSAEAAQGKRNAKKKTTRAAFDKAEGSLSEIEKSDGVAKLKRPSEMPFQPRVANTVQLIGRVGVPVQRQDLQDGRVTAVSVLVQEKYPQLPQFWIPIIFQGDLAETASTHLKENDTIHIVGQLSGDMPPFKINEGQANVQVLAHSLSYVKETGADMDFSFMDEKENLVPFIDDIKSNPSITPFWEDKKSNPSITPSWEDTKSNPSITPSWEDMQSNPSITPSWEDLQSNPSITPSWENKKSNSSITPSWENKKSNSSITPSWEDLVSNPQNWDDNRTDKQNGLKNPRYPDFKNKVTKAGLWLNKAPDWILERLSDLDFDNLSRSPLQENSNNAAHSFGNDKKANAGSKEDLWKDLLENREDWWDNRINKKHPRGPDFSKKATKEALWLNEAPNWAMERLNDPNSNNISPFCANKTEKFRAKEDLWKNLVENPNAWYDKRSNKTNPKQPDFKHKQSGDALWISNSTPEWVLSKLPLQIEKKGSSYNFVDNDDSNDVSSKSYRSTLLS